MPLIIGQWSVAEKAEQKWLTTHEYAGVLGRDLVLTLAKRC